MARMARTTNTTKPGAPARKPGRPISSAKKASANVTRTPAAGASPKLSKEELRARVEKLERANATLRAKGRELGRNAKSDAARIEELEEQVARLEKPADSPTSRARSGGTAAATTRRTRSGRLEHDPGDAVPPGVAVEDPEPPDEEAVAARENLEEHLSGE